MAVDIQIGDKSLMMIFLLEECNLNCPHCSREDEPMEPGYRLTFDQLQRCLADCRKLESVRWVHFSGGEPTLWTEGNRALVDLLLRIAAAGYTPGFTSNGTLFTDYDKCRRFFQRYVGDTSLPLKVYFSIDTFHRNFDRNTGRAQCLDNVLNFKRELPSAQAGQLDIRAMAVISKNPKSLLPEEMIRHYESQGIAFGFVPLHKMGKAKSFGHLCPDLESDDAEALGAYARYFRPENRKPRSTQPDRLRTDHIILIGNGYWFSDPWTKVGKLGRLRDEVVQAYS
jgi:MoaA/NifB/PqqE/SkfB family radical SAM enzyme